MPVQKIVSILRARSEKKQREKREKEDEADRLAKSLETFLCRLEEAFPGRELPKGKTSPEKLAEVVRTKKASRGESNGALLVSLKSFGVSAWELSVITEEAASNPSVFARRWIGELARKGQVKLSDVSPVSFFPKVLVAIREKYAEDIAGDIFVRDVAKIVVEKVLVKPEKRA
jgi:hypothetical protein